MLWYLRKTELVGETQTMNGLILATFRLIPAVGLYTLKGHFASVENSRKVTQKPHVPYPPSRKLHYLVVKSSQNT